MNWEDTICCCCSVMLYISKQFYAFHLNLLDEFLAYCIVWMYVSCIFFTENFIEGFLHDLTHDYFYKCLMYPWKRFFLCGIYSLIFFEYPLIQFLFIHVLKYLCLCFEHLKYEKLKWVFRSSTVMTLQLSYL